MRLSLPEYGSQGMKVLLVNMPWAPVDLPCLGIGILKTAAEAGIEDCRVEVHYANIDYIDWIDSRTDFTSDDYGYFSLNSYFYGVGDWIFSSALYGDPKWRVREFSKFLTGKISPDLIQKSVDLHTLAPEFVTHISKRIVSEEPDVVGFTAMFQQTTSALAGAKCIKEMAPHIVTVLGGSSFDAEQGAAVHRNFSFVDYVVRGEGEISFPRLLNSFSNDGQLKDIPGLCWRDTSGHSAANAMSTIPISPGSLVTPDYHGYFERLRKSAASSWAVPALTLEGSRGCWWGEKHQCTFCGLNGSLMKFRSKGGEEFYSEIIEQVRQHRILDIYLVDNILEMGYLKSLVPLLTQDDYHLRFHVEVKSNLRRDQLGQLAAAGMTFVQPGIESLSSRVLRLMDKGVTGCQNVRFLRDGQEAGLSIEWLYLHGFPGELPEDYDEIISQFPALEHLEPPTRKSARIAIERYSPYFSKPELGFFPLRSAEFYGFTYALPEAELFDLAYVFDASPKGIGRDVIRRLNEGLQVWIEAHEWSRLTHTDLGDRIVLMNRRRSYAWLTHVLDDPVEIALFRLLDQPHKLGALVAKTAQAVPHAHFDDSQAMRILSKWKKLGLIFTDDGTFIHVAPRMENQELLKIFPVRHLPEVSERSPLNRPSLHPSADTGGAAGSPNRPQTSLVRPSSTRLTVTCWKDYEHSCRTVAGMHLGKITIDGPPAVIAQSLWDQGARRVELPEWTVLSPDGALEQACHTLGLVGNLTSLAVFVDWRLVLEEGAPPWLTLSHLHPPSELHAGADGDEILRQWRQEYYLGKCVWLRGPGFIQIRDRRWNGLRRFTLTDSQELAAVEALSKGDSEFRIPRHVLDGFRTEDLTIPIGGQTWFAPYLMRRRPKHAW
ncbi:RiPP maturation radical SAM C-methyltransferase [Streptomyces sp. NPDC091376]|uniref:RiPP maturation radical SAM C-methyltransferase n=1 Tax=Streptomyces sp. NPDC091376 TaxID=3365994 RepID=UPI003823B2D4